jgi:hypothetical protein
MDENAIIRFVKGTSVNLAFEFDEDISSYTGAEFVIKKDYNTPAVITKTITDFEPHSFEVELTPQETEFSTEFLNGKNSAEYIWGLDILDSENDLRINVFPQTGSPAPKCIVYKHV